MDSLRMNRVWMAVLVAAVLWFVMFSPLTAPSIPFWPVMTASGVLLTLLSLRLGGNPFQGRSGVLSTMVLGVGLAVGLWCFFWLGDKVSQLLFSFARPQVDVIYDMGSSFPRWAIALLLLFVIGPAEELFWRGFVQRRMAERWGAWGGFAVATLCYCGAATSCCCLQPLPVASAGGCSIVCCSSACLPLSSPTPCGMPLLLCSSLFDEIG